LISDREYQLDMGTIGRVVDLRSVAEINHSTYRTQGELACPDLRSTTRPIVPMSSWYSRSEINHSAYRTQVELAFPDLRSTTLDLGTIGGVVDLRSGIPTRHGYDRSCG
jgi:hypothetical protein